MGVTFSGGMGAYILFDTTDCLCLNQTECKPYTSHLYDYTHHGLDRMLKKYFEIGNTLTQFHDFVSAA